MPSYLDKPGLTYFWSKLKSLFDDKQDLLESGTNIKTINNQSLLGSGDITISGGGSTTTWYGTSSTVESTSTKVVTCAGFTLEIGAIISVMFSTANTSSTLYFNINNTGQIAVLIGGDSINGTTNTLKWSTYTLVTVVYDGTRYRYISSRASGAKVSPDGAGSWYGTSNTAANTAAKVTTITNFRLTQGALVHVAFSTANTYVSDTLTLNVNSTNARNIWYNNAVTSATNPLLWESGDVLTFVYDGTYYRFVSKEIRITQSITSGALLATINGRGIYANYVDRTTPRVNLDTTAATGTTDGDLYAAITDLAWESEVIV